MRFHDPQSYHECKQCREYYERQLLIAKVIIAVTTLVSVACVFVLVAFR